MIKLKQFKFFIKKILMINLHVPCVIELKSFRMSKLCKSSAKCFFISFDSWRLWNVEAKHIFWTMFGTQQDVLENICKLSLFCASLSEFIDLKIQSKIWHKYFSLTWITFWQSSILIKPYFKLLILRDFSLFMMIRRPHHAHSIRPKMWMKFPVN